jgi:tellurite resistance-related uncharacterized protein
VNGKVETTGWITKVWGKTRCVARGPNFEVHELHINQGGYCSRHRHLKWNQFHVMSGTVKIQLFSKTPNGLLLEDEPSFETHLIAGEEFQVSPQLWHRFEAVEKCHVLEVYWTDGIDPLDIERYDEGGVLA